MTRLFMRVSLVKQALNLLAFAFHTVANLCVLAWRTAVATRGAKRVVTALVALRNMFGYSTRMRSLSEGRATFVMTF